MREDELPKLPEQIEQKYEVTKETLGYGSFAVVKVCKERTTGTELAIKIIAQEPLITSMVKSNRKPEWQSATAARDEIDILTKIQHPNIIRVWDVYETKEALFIVMDLCRGDELYDRIVSRVHYDEYDARIVMRQVLEGVAYLHDNGIIHRDLKPENILLKDRKDPGQIVISDFGLAKLMPDEGLLFTACGSPQYVAPEVLIGEGYNFTVDMWSCGVIAFALLSGYTPFSSEDTQTLFRMIVQMTYTYDKRYWNDQSLLARDFIDRCLCHKDKRITAHEALKHPWVADIPTDGSAQENRGALLKGKLEHLLEINRRDKAMSVNVNIERFHGLKRMRETYSGGLSSGVTTPTQPAQKTQRQNSDQSRVTTRPSAKRSGSYRSDVPFLQTEHFIRESPRPGRSKSSPETLQTINKMLEQYTSEELPPLARIDPSVQTQEPGKQSLSTYLKMIPALFNQSLAIGYTMVSHAVYGPPKKSWGVEMSVLTHTIREMATKHSDLATIPFLKKVFDLARFIPLPDDGLITPVTFRARRRNLRGFLAEADAQENGRRELTGEWVVCKQTWRRLQTEWQSGKRTDNERVIMYIHGGAYYVMSATTHRPLTIALSRYTECRIFSVNYRLAPDTVFPGALVDCVYAWMRLTEDLSIPPNNIVLGADSAGAGLAMALMLYLRDNKYPLPAGAILFSPWVDLTMSCDSWETNAKYDFLPLPKSGDPNNPISAYLGPNVDKYLTHPYVSPLFGDMHGLPPLLIQSGDAEVLRDEGTLLAHKCALAGVAVRHEIYEDGVHVFQFFLFLDASRKALQSARHFMRTALNRRPKRRASQVTSNAREQLDSEMRHGMGSVLCQHVDPSTGQAVQSEPEKPKRMNTLQVLDPDEEEEQTWDFDVLPEGARTGTADPNGANSDK